MGSSSDRAHLAKWAILGQALCVVTGLAGSAHAAVGVSQTNALDTTSETGFPVSSTDLINTGQTTSAGQTTSGYAAFSNNGQTSTTAALTDGSPGTVDNLNNSAFDLDGTWTSTFHLNDTQTPAGYNIATIQTIASWSGGRTNQQYVLPYSTVTSNPSNNDVTGFTSLGTFSYTPNANNSGQGTTRITLDITGLSGVNAVQFQFQNPPANNASSQTVYREVDVFSSVPEPASLGTLGLSVVGLLRRRRRGA